MNINFIFSAELSSPQKVNKSCNIQRRWQLRTIYTTMLQRHIYLSVPKIFSIFTSSLLLCCSLGPPLLCLKKLDIGKEKMNVETLQYSVLSVGTWEFAGVLILFCGPTCFQNDPIIRTMKTRKYFQKISA